jgi:hypothetical protein
MEAPGFTPGVIPTEGRKAEAEGSTPVSRTTTVSLVNKFHPAHAGFLIFAFLSFIFDLPTSPEGRQNNLLQTSIRPVSCQFTKMIPPIFYI